MMNNHSNISTNESNDGDENSKKFLTPKNVNHFDRNWFYSQQKLSFNNPPFYSTNLGNQPNTFEDIRYGKASSFCNPSEYYLNKVYNNNLNLVESMFSLNLDKVNSEKKKSKKRDDMDENQNVIYLEHVRNSF
jgi:hypothetical protein